MKKILIFSPTKSDACSFYRGMGVFGFIPQMSSKYTFEYAPEKVEWSSIIGASLLFMQRPYHDKHLTIAEIAKRQMPLWIDFDDALFDVPASNPAYPNYMKPSVQSNMTKLCQMADIITFTSETCRDAFLLAIPTLLNAKCHIIPNAYNNYILPLTQPPAQQEKVIFWRGSEIPPGRSVIVCPGTPATDRREPKLHLCIYGRASLDAEEGNHF